MVRYSTDVAGQIDFGVFFGTFLSPHLTQSGAVV